MRTLQRVLAALEALLPPLVAYYEDARVIGVCVDPSCTRTGGGRSHLQVDPTGTVSDIALALLLGIVAALLIWRHAADRRPWQLALMVILIPLCGMAFILFAFSTLSWTAATLGVFMAPAVFIGNLNQFLWSRRQ